MYKYNSEAGLFGFEGRIWDLIVSVPDHCLSFYFVTGVIPVTWAPIENNAK